jgi:hypothetical protein
MLFLILVSLKWGGEGGKKVGERKYGMKGR